MLNQFATLEVTSFLIAGDGSQKESLKVLLDTQIGSNIKFLGLLDKEEMIEFYNRIDIYVSTSLSDGGLAASIAEVYLKE